MIELLIIGVGLVYAGLILDALAHPPYGDQ